ncbi:citrate lyase acyl carrier protein [Acetobacter papayae]|uniref:citrate lyase acyl carrier protein n=1 Tax=Acetobacter papayae TaxID=1076592 RepID=UPI000471DD61|nr:citrate lyase acyl carrier protein [Acetobacter papayae]
MNLIQKGIAGTLESSDILVIVNPQAGGGVQLSIQSKVEKQFGATIRRVIVEKLEALGVTDVVVDVKDQGALDCVIAARVQAAVYRAAGVDKVNYEVLS